ncbi:MAG: hypothetical protein ACXABY_07170 [Candidatus Thorarchaeota archaeon]|jgi:hypothetical protein
MIMCFEIKETGNLVEIPHDVANRNSSSIYCFIDQNRRTIYFWKGRDTGFRQNFVGAKAVTKLREELGMEFAVQPVDEDDEPYEFPAIFR